MLTKYLLYLLIFLIPIQLGRHFFFSFTTIAGIPSDYLTPTVYLTDCVILLLIFLDIKSVIASETKPPPKRDPAAAGQSRSVPPHPAKAGFAMTLIQNRILFIFLGYCLFSSIFIAVNKWSALYKFIKIIEFVWLFKIIIKAKLNFRFAVTSYSLAVIYSSVLAIGQFFIQRSVGGYWWFLGERSFYASTPGIALGNVDNFIFLRPYGTFAHPNILAGFLALGLPLVFLYLWKGREAGRRIGTIFSTTLILGTITLILVFSRAAWAAFIFGLVLVILAENKSIRKFLTAKKFWYFWIFIALFILSIVIPLVISQKGSLTSRSLNERRELILASLTILKQNPLFGTGINNSIIRQYQILPKKYGTFIFQPVHNSYLLIWTELGTIGFLFLLIFLYKVFIEINLGNIRQYLPFFTVLFLGFFDHYLISLQQGLLILILFTSLVFWQQT